MIKLGERQTLTIVKKTEFGVYLKDTTDKGDDFEILLPKAEVSKEMDIMDPVDVFVYKDSKDRLIATVKEPYIRIGEIGKLRVKDINSVGAFLEWGLVKDLFLPFREQRGQIKVGDEVTVRCYSDKSGRLSASMWMSDEEKKTGVYEKNAQKLLQLINRNGGELPVGDKSSPEMIKAETGMSKNEFKRAAGNLYKDRKVLVGDFNIKRA